MIPFDPKNIKTAEPRTFPIWNETAVIFNDSRCVCSKPRSHNLSKYERVIYSPDLQTPIYGIERLVPETEEPERKVASSVWFEEKQVMF